jgi:ABC-2 type transport system permease protein
MKRYLKLYVMFIQYSLMKAIAYKQDFLIWASVMIGWVIINLVFYQLLYLNVDSIAGWTKGEMLTLQGFYFIFDFIIWGIFWPNMYQLPRKINTGELDFELTKPINTQFLISFKNIDLDNFTQGILGVITIIYGLRLLQITPTLTQILLSLLALMIAAVFVYAAYFITMCFAFWQGRIDNLQFLLPSVRHLWRNPDSFYRPFLHYGLMLVIPITLVTTTPTRALLNTLTIDYLIALGLMALTTLLASHFIFKFALTRYSSASS